MHMIKLWNTRKAKSVESVINQSSLFPLYSILNMKDTQCNRNQGKTPIHPWVETNNKTFHCVTFTHTVLGAKGEGPMSYHSNWNTVFNHLWIQVSVWQVQILVLLVFLLFDFCTQLFELVLETNYQLERNLLTKVLLWIVANWDLMTSIWEQTFSFPFLLYTTMS